MTTTPQEVSHLLRAWSDGDQTALDKLLPLVYEELRRMAKRHMGRQSPGHTLQTTALIHEAYLRLVDQKETRWQNRAHFFAVAARAMRSILVDYARARHAAKRGGGALVVSLDEAAVASDERAAELVALDDALESLSAIDRRKCRVAELWRMVRPGGQLAITTWGPNFCEPANTIFWDTVRMERPDLYKGFNPWDRICDPQSVKTLGERILQSLPDDLPEYQSVRSRTAAAYVKRWKRCFDEQRKDVDGCVRIRTKRNENEYRMMEQILADLNRAIQLEPENAEYYYLRFSVLHERGCGGASDLDRAIELDPSNAMYYFARYFDRKNLDAAAAARDRQRAAELGYEVPEPWGGPKLSGGPIDWMRVLNDPPAPLKDKERWRLKCLK